MRAARTCVLVMALVPSSSGAVPPGTGAAESGGEFTWRQVMYLGGHPDVRTPSRTWDNRLTISGRHIILKMRNGTEVDVDALRITGLAFERKRYRIPAGERAGAAATAGPLIGAVPVVVYFALMSKKEDHFIAIEYLLPDDRPAGLLLRAHKSNYRAMGEALRRLTDAQPVENESAEK